MLKLSGINQFYGQSHTLWDLDIEIAHQVFGLPREAIDAWRNLTGNIKEH